MVLLLFLYACSTTSIGEYENSQDILRLFSGDLREDWTSGLEIIQKDVNERYFITLFTLYLDEKYSDIKKELVTLIQFYEKNINIDYSKVLDLINSPEDVLLLTELVGSFDDTQIIKYSKTIFVKKTPYRDLLLEELGLNILQFNHVLELFNSDVLGIKSGVLYSTGFMKSDEINSWIVERLFDESEELSSGAVFSLSRHGNSGYSLLSKNLLKLSDRLIPISIDLLIYNKFIEAYDYFPDLLINKNDIVAEKIFAAYENLGTKGSFYILKSLTNAHNDYKLQLLKLLEKIDNSPYLGDIYYLLENKDLQPYIIDLYFRSKSFYLIQKLLISGTYGLEDKIITFGVESGSELLFQNRVISEFTLKYFINKLTFKKVKSYFEIIGFDDNYIDDYESILSIYNDLSFIDSVEKENGVVNYISRYFELEQVNLIADQELAQFYKGMENWLEDGDFSNLEQSLEIKEANNPEGNSIEQEKSDYLKSLIKENREIINKYESSKLNIIRSYRNLTFRLKNFGRDLIFDSGYISLIE